MKKLNKIVLILTLIVVAFMLGSIYQDRNIYEGRWTETHGTVHGLYEIQLLVEDKAGLSIYDISKGFKRDVLSIRGEIDNVKENESEMCFNVGGKTCYAFLDLGNDSITLDLSDDRLRNIIAKSMKLEGFREEIILTKDK